MDQNKAFLIHLFEGILNPDPKIRDPANESILKLIQTDPMTFIYQASQIILTDGFPDSIYRMAFTLIGHSITPSINLPISLIASTFLDNSNAEKRAIIKNASLRGLMFSDQVIRQQASYCIYLLLQIEENKWIDLFQNLFKIASEYSNEARCGAIYCFKNIVSSKISFDLLKDAIQNFYILLVHFFFSQQATLENYFDECFGCYLAILSRLEKSSNINNEIANKCFEIIDKSISIYGLTKSNFYLSALFTIIKGIYSTSIFDYLQRYLILSTKILQEGDFDQQIDVFLRWTEFAKFELEQPNRQNIIESISSSFFPIILKVILTGIQNCTSINDFFDPTIDDSSKQAYFAGSQCLSSFYKVATNTIFQFVSNLWTSTNFSTTNEAINALIALLPIIKRKPEFMPLPNFIEDHIKVIILKMTISDNEFISILSLLLIQKSLLKFGCFIRNQEEINFLLNLLQQSSMIKDKIAFPYCCDVIYSMCKFSNDRIKRQLDTINNTVIAENFDNILQLLRFFISNSNTYLNIRSSFCALATLIPLIPDSRIQVILDIQENIIKKTLIQTMSSENTFSQEILFSLQYNMIDLIQSIALRLTKSSLKLQNADELIKLLFALSKQQRTSIYEETLGAFSAIIICMKTDYEPYINPTMDLILVMIRTGSPNIIKFAILTISDLFRRLNVLMQSYTDPVFKLLIPMIYGGNLNRDLVIDIIMTLADITKTINVPLDDRNEYFKVLLQLAKTINLNPSNKNEKKFINEFFHSVFYGISAVIESSLNDPSFHQMPYNEVFLPLIKLYSQTETFDDMSLYTFCLFIQSLANLYGRPLTVHLNNRRISKIIQMAKNSMNPACREKADETYKKLQSL